MSADGSWDVMPARLLATAEAALVMEPFAHVQHGVSNDGLVGTLAKRGSVDCFKRSRQPGRRETTRVGARWATQPRCLPAGLIALAL